MSAGPPVGRGADPWGIRGRRGPEGPAGPSRVRRRAALCLAVLAAALACARLGAIVVRTEWTMDADEAVHAVEALRLFDRLEHGELALFLRDTYLPERWHPPVDPHVRWYPFVHAWLLLPSFALLGPSDVAARLPSVALLLGSALVFFALGRRLAPRTPAASGLLATLLLLGAPNVLTFSAQTLIEPASLFTAFLALLAYVVSLERGHRAPWAALAGGALALTVLTKYDHGGLLALSLGIAELVRVRGRVPRLVREGGLLLFGIPLAAIALWFAHPDKLAALGDSVRHPFHGSPRLIFLDLALTWWTEYAASLAIGALAAAALVLGWRRWSDERVRALWLWAVLTTVFLAARARFHFRYNFVEAPAVLLLLAVLLPAWLASWGRAVARAPHAWAGALGAAGVVAVAAGGWLALEPEAVFAAAERPFGWLYELREDRWGLSLPPAAYVEHYATEYRGAAVHLGGSLFALGLGGLVAAAAALAAAGGPVDRVRLSGALGAALAVAAVPGVVRLYAELPGMVEWELEGHPELGELEAFVARHAGAPPVEVLLAGGWDQLTNNGLRWTLLTEAEPRPRYDEVVVTGDMIGSIVFPPEPRVRWHALRLATAPAAELPDRIVLVTPGPDFLYESWMGVETRVYREVLDARGGWRTLAERRFDALGCTAEVLAPDPAAPAPPVAAAVAERALARHGVPPDVAPEASRELVGEGGWAMRDESLRHHWTPARTRRP